jgi:hypothetical protein
MDKLVRDVCWILERNHLIPVSLSLIDNGNPGISKLESTAYVKVSPQAVSYGENVN